jgi:hypothetical protein
MIDEDPPQIVVCQGPPCCDKEGDEAVAQAEAGCIWCERHTLQSNGDWHVQKPGSA